MKQVNTDEAQAHFTKLIAQAEQGEEIIIARDGKPVARLIGIGIGETSARRQPGRDRGRIQMADDFDAPLPDDLQRLFEA